MAYDVHLHLQADLIGVARVLRVLRRHAIVPTEVAVERLPGTRGASVHGTLRLHRKAEALVAALVRTPDVSHAAILHDSGVVFEFSRRPR